MTGTDEMARIYIRNIGFKAEAEVTRFIEKTQLSDAGKVFWNEVLQLVKAILSMSRQRQGRHIA